MKDKGFSLPSAWQPYLADWTDIHRGVRLLLTFMAFLPSCTTSPAHLPRYPQSPHCKLLRCRLRNLRSRELYLRSSLGSHDHHIRGKMVDVTSKAGICMHIYVPLSSIVAPEAVPPTSPRTPRSLKGNESRLRMAVPERNVIGKCW